LLAEIPVSAVLTTDRVSSKKKPLARLQRTSSYSVIAAQDIAHYLV
jgi:hypothetical protein